MAHERRRSNPYRGGTSRITCSSYDIQILMIIWHISNDSNTGNAVPRQALVTAECILRFSLIHIIWKFKVAASASPLMLDCSSPMAHLSGTFSTFMNFTPVRNLFHPQAPEFLICCQIWIKHFHCFNIVWIFTTYSVDPLPLKPQVSSVSWVENLSWFNFSSRLSSNLMVNRSGSPYPPQYFWSSTIWANPCAAFSL